MNSTAIRNSLLATSAAFFAAGAAAQQEVARAAAITRGVPGVKDVRNDILLKQVAR